MLHQVNDVPWGQEIAVNGSLWFRNERLRWRNGATWLSGRKILCTYDSSVIDSVTDEFSAFSFKIHVSESLGRTYSVKAQFPGDGFFDKCESNEIAFCVRKHKTQISLQIDALRIGKIGNVDIQNAKLNPNQNYRIEGMLTDLDTQSGVGQKQITISNIHQSVQTSSNGSFQVINLRSPNVKGKYYIEVSFSGDDLYDEANAKIEYEVSDNKPGIEVRIKEETRLQERETDIDSPGKISLGPTIFKLTKFIRNDDLCFVAMPFKPQFFRIFNNNLKPVLLQYFKEVVTVDDIFTSTSIMDDVWLLINNARLVVVDLTGKNPDVFYELGMAHAIPKAFIMITQNKNDAPFDVHHIRSILYSDDQEGLNVLERKLAKFIESTIPDAKSKKRQRITRILGEPDEITNGIQFYSSRSRISLENLMSQVTNSVEMISLSFYNIIMNHFSLIKKLLENNVVITFVILNPSSKFVEERKTEFQEGEEIKHHIERALISLCRLREDLCENFKENLKIKTHESNILESVILIDNELVKIEEYGTSIDPHYRHGRLTFKKDNKDFFDRYLHLYNSITKKDYIC